MNADEERCAHLQTECLNHYELIRKYRCLDCGAVMMCACDEVIGRRYLSHQLNEGVELETQARVAVTLGFQPGLCDVCRGRPATPHPVAEIHGRTSKLKRYYWREIQFRLFERVDEWKRAHQDHESIDPATYRLIEAEVVEEVRHQHGRAPKYVLAEESEAAFLEKRQVQVTRVDAEFLSSPDRHILLADDEGPCRAEEFAARSLRRSGWKTLFLESKPFHVLFGTFLWFLITDPTDERVIPVQFGDRNFATEPNRIARAVHLFRPEDFGSVGYARRRADAIDLYFHKLAEMSDDLLWLFDYWLEPSRPLRQYLWAHESDDIERARVLVSILPSQKLLQILRYLIDGYWQRYLGWPDLLAYKSTGEQLWVEVKASRDKLSDDQRNWIAGNAESLGFAFQLFKIHRENGQRNQAGHSHSRQH